MVLAGKAGFPREMSRIFISHSSKDNPAAVAIAEWLKEEGWDDVFLDLDPVQGIHPGERWERALYDHAADCEAVLFLISKSWLESEWCKREFELARKLNKRCFVVLVEQIAIDDLPLSLKETHQTVSLAAGEDHKVFRPKLPITHQEGYVTFSSEGLSRLKIGLENAGLDPRFFLWPPPNDPSRAPYRGLEALDSIDAGVFFGRDGPIIQALDQLRGLSEAAPPRIFVILGASGAGKSSFLRAGLLPRLARDNRAFIVLPVIRPEGAAISGPAGLIESIAEAIVLRGLSTTRAEIRQAITEGPEALQRILKVFNGHGNQKRSTIILTIDQSEELFRAEAADEANALFTLVKAITKTDDPSVMVIFVIRSDSYDALQSAKPLEGLKQETFALLPMPHGAYQTVIEGPLRRLRASGRKFEIDPGLTEALLEDIEQGGGSDALPLLAFTLQLLYRDHEAAKHISLADYRDFGGLKGAINAALKRAFLAADADPRVPRDYDARLALLRRGFIPWLAGVDPETRTLRRRVARAAQIPEEARPLLNLLIEERLLTRDVDKQTGEATVEPAHEALLRQWGGLKGWLEEDFGRLAALEGVKRAATDWDANARNEAWLAHGGGRLAEANQLDLRPDLAELLNGTDRAYLAACRAKEQETLASEEERRRVEASLEREKHQRMQQRARFMHHVAIISGMAVIGLLGLSAWVIRERNTAISQIEAATKTANYLTKDLVSNIENISGVPVATVLGILNTAHQLQEDLTGSGFKNTDLAKSHALSRERMVSICIEFGDLNCARQSADEAVDLRKSLLEADPQSDEREMDLARAEDRSGDVMKEFGNLDEAMKVYTKALATQARLIPIKEFNDVWLSDLASSREGIGDVLLLQGSPEKIDEAYKTYRAAQDDWVRLTSARPDIHEWVRRQALNEGKIGDTLFAKNERGSALILFKRAASKLENLKREEPNNTQIQQDLATSQEKIGDMQLSMNQLNQALLSFEQGFNTMKALVDSDSANARWQRELAVIQLKIGDVYLSKGDVADAQTIYADALSRIQTAARRDEKNSQLKMDWSRSLSRVGDIQLRLGQLDAAVRSYQESIEKIDRQSAMNSADWLQDISRLNDYIGEILFYQKDYNGAINAFSKSLQNLERIAQANHSDFDAKLRVVEAHKKLAYVDKPNLEKHTKAAEQILEEMLRTSSDDGSNLDAERRRVIEYEMTKLSDADIGLYRLLARHARVSIQSDSQDTNFKAARDTKEVQR